MKLESFLRTGIIASVTLFIIVALVYGDSFWYMSTTYNLTPSTTFNSVNSSLKSNYATVSIIKYRYENNTLLRYTRVGQSEQDPTTDDTSFFEYQARSFEATGQAVANSRDWDGTIVSLGHYLQIPTILTGTAIVLLIISMAFALITFWRGRRP